MAATNTLGTLSPDVISLDILQILKKRFPMLTAVATDFSDEPVRLNTRIISRVATVPAVSSYTQATGYAETAAGTTDVPVQINNFRYVGLSFHDDELASTPRNLVQEQIEGAAYALGKDAFDKLMALCIVANFPTHTVSTAASLTRDQLTAVRYQLQAAGASVPRYGILDSAGMEYLLQDPTIISRFYINIEDAAVDQEAGILTGIGGFEKIYEYADLTTDAPNTLGFFGNKNALILAARVPSDPASFVADIPINAIIKNVTDEETGLTVQYRYHYDVKLGRLDMILTWIFGVAVGVPGHAALLTLT
jgi:hypothetical protein